MNPNLMLIITKSFDTFCPKYYTTLHYTYYTTLRYSSTTAHTSIKLQSTKLTVEPLTNSDACSFDSQRKPDASWPLQSEATIVERMLLHAVLCSIFQLYAVRCTFM